jgi:hypothetical protein
MSYLQDTLDAVENLLKKHEAFEKSAATQEERFAALEKLTTVSTNFLSTNFLMLIGTLAVVCSRLNYGLI